jgi:NTP pyrophosphatase (non-canonical NTP hydrolase)
MTRCTERTLANTQARLVEFNRTRDWLKYHALKDLAAAIAVEAAELQELFLWQRAADEFALLERRRDEIEDELADVLIQCLNLAARADVDVLEAIERKIAKNAEKYPVGESEPRRWT